MSSATPDVACTTLPSGSTWYSTVNSNAPWNGTTAAMPYEWVRVNWKLNNSASYLTATTVNHVTTLSASTYSVNGTQAAASPVCWNGASEVVLTSGSSCNTLTTGGTAATPVFVITALGVTSTGARQMVQEEVAAQPPTVISTPAGFSDPDGFFAASSSCSALSPADCGKCLHGRLFQRPWRNLHDHEVERARKRRLQWQRIARRHLHERRRKHSRSARDRQRNVPQQRCVHQRPPYLRRRRSNQLTTLHPCRPSRRLEC